MLTPEPQIQDVLVFERGCSGLLGDWCRGVGFRVQDLGVRVLGFRF